MKFSYSLIREMVPNLPSIKKLAEELALKSFEVDGISGDMMDIKITANRWCDASSHEGIAREAAAIFGSRLIPVKMTGLKNARGRLGLKVINGSDCYRYIGLLAELQKRGTTPSWMKKYLSVCGIKSINPVVDVLNYVMVEIGQPMHAFDADKVEGDIIVRKANKGEKIKTIDGGEYELTPADTVIADEKKTLAIAGIKGGKAAEISRNTKRIIIESANFDSVSVYRTSKRIRLETDASRRYGHGMSSEKAKRGMERALRLLTEICFVKPIAAADEYKVKEPRRFIKFNPERFEKITGVAVSKNQAAIILKKLGFKMKGDIAEVPAERIDVSLFEDLTEEVIRIYGLNEIKAVAPVISIVPAHNDSIFGFREKVQRAFAGIGYDEIVSYSFGDYGPNAPEIANPISQDKAFMRTGLIRGLDEAIEKNKKAFSEIRIFEFGKVFDGVGKEHWSVAAAVKTRRQEYPQRILRGAVEEALRRIGIGDAELIPEGQTLIFKIADERVGEMFVSRDGEKAFFEADAEKLMKNSEGEFEYEFVSPYPSAMRDISLWIAESVSVGELFEAVDSLNIADLNDVDLADYYPAGEDGRSGVTLRLVFQSPKKTLTDAEINVRMEQIKAILGAKKGVEIR
ncbi:MAG: phenylalanine--tRNA ligase subunit beta [Parcubacteria group bacterium]